MYRLVVILVVWCISFQSISAQLSVGTYAGEIRAIATDVDLQGQEQMANLDFRIHSIRGWTRSDFILPDMGPVTVIADSSRRESTSYFEFAGNKKAMVNRWSENDTASLQSNEFRFERGVFECMEGDTVIAGEACKKARWYPVMGQESVVDVWYATQIPNALPKRYVHLPGMPMCFVYRQNGITMQYRITEIQRELPDRKLFEPLTDYEMLQQQNEMEIGSKQ